MQALVMHAHGLDLCAIQADRPNLVEGLDGTEQVSAVGHSRSPRCERGRRVSACDIEGGCRELSGSNHVLKLERRSGDGQHAVCRHHQLVWTAQHTAQIDNSHTCHGGRELGFR